jgi:serine O-acetyltransferase
MNTESRARQYVELLATPFMLPLLIPYGLTNQRQVIREDVQRWAAELERPECASFLGMLRLLMSYPEFRSLFCHRLKCGNQPASLLSMFLRLVYRGQTALFLNCVDIGPGLFLQHAWCTAVGAERIGRNCWINQQVVIGHTNRDGGPVIGDNVTIHVGAKVLGPIRIGNNVKIGANALVVKDVPDDCVVLGSPGISRPRKTIEMPAAVS